MVVSVFTTKDILDEATGAIAVASGLTGHVINKSLGPPIKYQCRFFPNNVTTDVWLQEEQFIFNDGNIGPLRAFYEGSAVTITKIEYPDTVAPYDPLVNQGPLIYQGKVKITFSDSSSLIIETNRNSGNLDFTIG